MNDSQLEEQDKINKDIDLRYRDYIREIILSRFQLIISVGIVLHLAFFVIDRIAYPASASAFLKIRCVDAIALFIILLISFFKKIKPHAVWLTAAAGTVVIIGMCVMVLITDGSSNRYYEGANLVFLGVSIINPFFIGHLICALLVWIGLYDVSMFYGHGTFNTLNFYFANYFMSSTAFLVVLLAIFYKDQHYKSFVRQEKLKIHEETLTALYSQADKLSKTDTLTEVNNRRYFSDMLNKKIEGCEAAKTSFYLVILDLDHFKQINDTYGHVFGDAVLVSVIGVVKSNVRSSDFIGRFGGDEFVLCLDLPNKDGILSRLTKISTGIRALGLIHDGKEVPVSVSIGVAKFKPGEKMTEEKLMLKADFELFNVKKNARGEVSVDE